MWQRAGYNLRNINVIRHNPILVHRLVGPITHDTDCMQQQFFTMNLLIMLLFLTFSVLVANPKKLLYTVANPARGLLNREKRTKEKVWQHTPPRPPHCSFGENKRGSKTSQACYSHPRCNLNLVRLFRFSLPLPVFGRPFSSSPHPPTRL